MPLFIRVTVGLTLAIVAFVVLVFILKVVLFAALVAALIVGGAYVLRALGRRRMGAAIVPRSTIR